MAQEVRLWEITDEDSLQELNKSKLNFEERLEKWLEKDISIISNDLVVIGRQVETDFGGVIDLLCLDNNGDIVIVELKRDKTPREITAQILDYASWIKEIGSDRINEIANSYLADNTAIEEAFKTKFGEDFPEVLNERHKMLIVASEIDGSSERIIKYLSDTYGVDINAITFHYFKSEDGKEYLSRVFLIQPGEVEYKARTKSTSKRLPPLTFEELQNLADDNGVGNIYKKALEGLRQHFRVTRHKSAIAFKGVMGERKSPHSIIVFYLAESSSTKGLRAFIYIDRFSEYFQHDKETITQIFSPFENRDHDQWVGEHGSVYFKSEEDVQKLLLKLLSL